MAVTVDAQVTTFVVSFCYKPLLVVIVEHLRLPIKHRRLSEPTGLNF